MIEFTPLPEAKVRVTFTLTLKHEIKPDVTLAQSNVCVVGDFNGWDPHQTPLPFDSSFQQEGHEYRKYRGEAIVEAGFIHHYHFLVDGLHRWADPDNPHKIPNDKGGEDSILEAPMVDWAPPPATKSPARKKAGDASAKDREAALGSPEERLAEAARIFHETASSQKAAAERVGPLARAVRLDPYELGYRLSLAAAVRDAGRPEEAAGELRRALALWPDDPRLTLLLGQVLLEAGQAEEAKAHFSRVPDGGEFGRQRAYDLVELSIRQAQGPEDWKKVLEQLEPLDVDASTAGFFCEKCLKVLIEAESGEITARLKALAEGKLAGLEGHPACALFQRVAAFDPAALLNGAEPAGALPGQIGPTGPAELERFLKAYRLSNVPLDGGDGPASRIEGLAAWRRLVKTHGGSWPEIADAYIRQLDRWGGEAYRDKKFELAGVLWGEAERMDPANPAVLQNLALVHTRGKDERGYDWYWSRLVKTLVLQGEVAPWGGDYSRGLKEKHQAFVEGLQKAVPLAGDWRQALRLGAQMARETVSLLALRQIAFKNPLFRCGVCREDYAGPDERDQLILLGTASLAEWLKLAAGWEGLPEKGSALAAWRSERLNEALELAGDGGTSLKRSYEEERTAFKAHRGQAAQQFLGLLMVLKQVSEQSGAQSAAERADAMDVARAVMSFPHELIKPALVEMKALEPGTNVRELATNYAVLPWFAPAQRDFEQKRFDQALEEFRTVQVVAPDFLTGWFYAAQCYAALERFSEAFETARDALKKCPADDPMRPHLTQAIPQILTAWAGPQMQKENWLEARKILAKAASAGLRDARLVFYEAICLARAGQIGDAQTVAKQALSLAKKSGAADLEKEVQDFIPQIPVLMIGAELAEAQAAMNKKKWREALPVLDRAVTKAPASAFARFLKAVCLFNLSEIEKADDEARAGLKHADLPGLEQIKTQLQQIVTAATNHRQAAANKRKAEVLNPMFAAMKKERWSQALELSKKAFDEYPFDEHVRYYRALVMFQACMAELKTRGPFRYKSDAESFLIPRLAEVKMLIHKPGDFGSLDFLGGLGKSSSSHDDRPSWMPREGPELNFLDYELKKAAEQLDKAMDGVLAQLKQSEY